MAVSVSVISMHLLVAAMVNEDVDRLHDIFFPKCSFMLRNYFVNMYTR